MIIFRHPGECLHIVATEIFPRCFHVYTVLVNCGSECRQNWKGTEVPDETTKGDFF